MRILVTNDDGIDSIGLHVLARELQLLDGDHEIVVVVPDQEYSGASSAVGALHLIQPVVRGSHIDGFDGEVWKVNAPPALCVMFARLGAFNGGFDLVVSGINPGANVGRAVYHSGTVGATLTGRNGGISGIAISQAVSGYGVEGQGWDESIAHQCWPSAATVARTITQALLDDLPADPVVVNVNVPNLPLDQFGTWHFGEVGARPPRSVATAELHPVPGHEDTFSVTMDWGAPEELDPNTDGGIIEGNDVSITFLSRLVHEPRHDVPALGTALDTLLAR